MGSVVKTKVGEIEDNTREGRSRRLSKYVVVFVQNMVGKKRFLIQLEDGHKK